MYASADEIYERVCGIVMSDNAPLLNAMMLDAFREGLGSASDMIDDILYEHIGMSCEEVMEVLIDEDIHKSCQKHMPNC